MERDRRSVITTVRPWTVFLFATSRWSRSSIPASGRFHAINDRPAIGRARRVVIDARYSRRRRSIRWGGGTARKIGNRARSASTLKLRCYVAAAPGKIRRANVILLPTIIRKQFLSFHRESSGSAESAEASGYDVPREINQKTFSSQNAFLSPSRSRSRSTDQILDHDSCDKHRNSLAIVTRAEFHDVTHAIRSSRMV